MCVRVRPQATTTGLGASCSRTCTWRPRLAVPRSWSPVAAPGIRLACVARPEDAMLRLENTVLAPIRRAGAPATTARAADGRMTSRLPLQFAIVSIVTLEIEKHAVCPLVDLAHGPAEAAEVLREEGSYTLPRRRLSAHEAPQRAGSSARKTPQRAKRSRGRARGGLERSGSAERYQWVAPASGAPL